MSEVLSKDRAWYYRQLWLAVRQTIDPYFKNDKEAIDAQRDALIAEYFSGAHYTELSDSELYNAISAIYAGTTPVEPITFQQLRMIRFYVISLAVRYYDFKNIDWISAGASTPATPEEARREVKICLEKRNKIDSGIMAKLYRDYANPLLNRFLEEGCFRKPQKKDTLYYKSLKKNEASYLLSRLIQMAEAANIYNEEFSKSYITN